LVGDFTPHLGGVLTFLGYHPGLIRHLRKDEGADSFVPMLIYVVLRANPEHLLSNVEYVRVFSLQAQRTQQILPKVYKSLSKSCEATERGGLLSVKPCQSITTSSITRANVGFSDGCRTIY